MASWLFGSGSAASPLQQYDQLLSEATSEDLPTPPLNGAAPPDTLEKCLQMSDMVRSGQLKATDAVRGFKRRLAHQNPNVQLLALLALDVAIKNSGDAFLREVASGSSGSVAYVSTSTDTSLVDTIGNLARASANADVRATTLRLLQNWATAFESKPHLAISQLVLMYRRLKVEGCPFPPRDPAATAAMIDSMAAPEWKESDVCSRCRDPFSFTNRRHHCRNCGEIFDQKCSSKTMKLPHFGINEEVRVCDGCFKKVAGGGRRASVDALASPRLSMPSRSSSVRTPSTRHQFPSRQEEDDLQLALRLSLAEAQPSERPGYRPNTTSSIMAAPSQPPLPVGEGEDPELAAAIEASLRESQAPLPSAPTVYGDDASATVSSVPERRVPASFELADRDTDALLTFAQATGERRTDPTALGVLYDRAVASRPNLVRAVADVARRQQVLMEMSDKLTRAVKLYDGLLEQQVARHAYAPQPAMHAAHYAPQASASYGPSQPAYVSPVPPSQAFSPPPSLYPVVADAAPNHASAPVPAMAASPVPSPNLGHSGDRMQSMAPGHAGPALAYAAGGYAAGDMARRNAPGPQQAAPVQHYQPPQQQQQPPAPEPLPPTAGSAPPSRVAYSTAAPQYSQPARVYTAASFPTAPSDEPWRLATSPSMALEETRRTEAPLIEF